MALGISGASTTTLAAPRDSCLRDAMSRRMSGAQRRCAHISKGRLGMLLGSALARSKEASGECQGRRGMRFCWRRQACRYQDPGADGFARDEHVRPLPYQVCLRNSLCGCPAKMDKSPCFCDGANCEAARRSDLSEWTITRTDSNSSFKTFCVFDCSTIFKANNTLIQAMTCFMEMPDWPCASSTVTACSFTFPISSSSPPLRRKSKSPRISW